MAIDKNSKSMLNPYAPGDNFGISADYTLLDKGTMPSNYSEAISANQRFDTINAMIGKVTSTGSSGQENFPLGNNGASLGTAYDGKAQKNYGFGK